MPSPRPLERLDDPFAHDGINLLEQLVSTPIQILDRLRMGEGEGQRKANRGDCGLATNAHGLLYSAVDRPQEEGGRLSRRLADKVE